MSQNIHDIFVANPVTSNQALDLMYFGRSPYGATDDVAMLYSNFAAQFAGNVLSAKGDLYTFTTVNARLPVGTVNGQILQVDAATATGLAWSTASYPATLAINNLLYASAANTITGVIPGNSGVLASTAAGVPTWVAPMTNGELIIGSTGATPVRATLTAGLGVTITNGAGTITIASSGANPWVDQTTNLVTMAVNTGYTADAGAALIAFTLPTVAALGDWVEINGFSSGGWEILYTTNQQIVFGNQSTTLTSGSLASSNQFDCVKLRCIVPNLIFTVVSAVGNLTLA